ncbi:MAG: hypothetical protein ACYDCP_04040 [Thermoplasmataceae archaeon]
MTTLTLILSSFIETFEEEDSGIDSYKVFIDDFGGRDNLPLEIVKP